MTTWLTLKVIRKKDVVAKLFVDGNQISLTYGNDIQKFVEGDKFIVSVRTGAVFTNYTVDEVYADFKWLKSEKYEYFFSDIKEE